MDWYKDVFDLVFPDVDEAAVNSLWRKELAKPPKEDADADESEMGLLN